MGVSVVNWSLADRDLVLTDENLLGEVPRVQCSTKAEASALVLVQQLKDRCSLVVGVSPQPEMQICLWCDSPVTKRGSPA